MSGDYAQETDQTLGLRGNEAEGESSSNIASSSQPRSDGSSYGNQPLGIGGAFCSKSFAGGIVAQLIQEAEDRLGEAEACIAWYEDQKVKYQSKLDALRLLHHQYAEPDE